MLSVVANIFVVSTEHSLVDPRFYQRYLFLKVSIMVLLAAAGLFIRFRPHQALANYFVGVGFFLLCYVSTFFRPLYVIAIFEHFAVFTYAFPVSDLFFIIFCAGSFLAFAATQYFFWDHLPDSYARLSFPDFLHLDFQFAFIVLFFYFFFVKSRRFQRETEQRLAVIGRNASNIAHDLKGMIMGPNLYLGRLIELVGEDKAASKEIHEMLDLTTRQFAELEKMMASFNQLCLVEKSPVTDFSAKAVIESARQVLWKSASSCEIEVHGDLVITGERAAFLSFCYNVMINALQAMRSLEGKGCIRWEISEGTKEIRCLDNAGGFSSEALQAIRAGLPFSSKPTGSGLGIPVIVQAAQQLGANVTFSNEGEGALVTMRLP
jgi:signal transduction histidine kinase